MSEFCMNRTVNIPPNDITYHIKKPQNGKL